MIPWLWFSDHNVHILHRYTFPPSCPYSEVLVIPAVNAITENIFLLNNSLCSFHAINSLSSFSLLLLLQLRTACQIIPCCKGKKRQGRAWTRQEENLYRSCSQWQQLTRHKNGHGERWQPAWHFHPSHPPCSFWNTLSWWSLISSLTFCFAFAPAWIPARMADAAGILHPYPISIKPESRIPVFCSCLQNKAAHNVLSLCPCTGVSLHLHSVQTPGFSLEKL